MFINFTNHPSNNWGVIQIKESLKYGKIIDLPFPEVSVDADEKDINNLAEIYVKKIMEYKPKAVLVQGEMSLTFSIVARLLELNVLVLCACSSRCTTEYQNIDGTNHKLSEFRFEKYRAYSLKGDKK